MVEIINSVGGFLEKLYALNLLNNIGVITDLEENSLIISIYDIEKNVADILSKFCLKYTDCGYDVKISKGDRKLVITITEK